MICFIDFETTGIDVFRDEPIEIGAVLVNDELEVLKEFSSKITIQKSTYLTKRAYNIHNISVEVLRNAPDPKEVLITFFNEFGTDFRLGGWNINFDVSFLRKLCHKNGMMVKYNKINHRHIDIQSLGYLAIQLKIVEGNNNSLNDWKNYFGFKRRENHSALDDAKLTLKVYKELLNKFRDRINK